MSGPEVPVAQRAADGALVVHLEVPRKVWAALIAVALFAVVVVVIVVAQLEDTRSTLDSEVAAHLARVDASTRSLDRGVTPFVQAAQDDRAGARRLTRLSTSVLRDAGPLVATLRAANAGRQLERSGALATNLLGVDAGRQIAASGQLSRTLLRADVGTATTAVRDADLPALSAAVRDVTRELTTGDRLRRLLAGQTSLLDDVRTSNLVAKLSRAARAVPNHLLPQLSRIVTLLTSTRDITRSTNEVTRDTNAVTRDTNALTRNTNEVTRDTNRRVTDIDRRLGGDVPLP